MKGILSPVWVAGFYWTMVLGFTLLLYPESSVEPWAIVYVAVAVLAFTVGALVAVRRPVLHRMPSRPPRPHLLTKFVYVGASGNLAASLLALRANDLSLREVFSLEGLFSSANAVAVARYGGDIYSTPLSSFMLGLGYVAAMLAPFAYSRTRRRLTLLAPVISSLVYAAVTTERLGLLVTVALTTGSLISRQVVEEGRVPNLSPRLLVTVVVAGLGVGMIFTSIAFLRVGKVDASVSQQVWDKQVTYALGSVPAFSLWYERHVHYPSELPIAFGSASIAGVGLLSARERSDYRAYTEFVTIDSTGRSTNVYTIFRGAILDFSEAGALAVFAMLGLLFGTAYRSAMAGSYAAAAAMSNAYALILLSNTMAISTFSNVLMAMLLGPVLLRASLVPADGSPDGRPRKSRVQDAVRHRPSLAPIRN